MLHFIWQYYTTPPICISIQLFDYITLPLSIENICGLKALIKMSIPEYGLNSMHEFNNVRKDTYKTSGSGLKNNNIMTCREKNWETGCRGMISSKILIYFLSVVGSWYRRTTIIYPHTYFFNWISWKTGNRSFGEMPTLGVHLHHVVS